MINLSCLIICEEKKQKPGLYPHQADNILELNPQFFCLPANSQRIYPLLRWTAKSEAIKIAVSFSKFECFYTLLLLWDNSKRGFTVLKNFKVEINFGWSHLDESIIWLFANRLHYNTEWANFCVMFKRS